MKIAPHIALLVANALLGANFSLYASLYAAGLSYEEIFLIQILSSVLLFLPLSARRLVQTNLPIEDFGTIFTIAIIVTFGWLYMLTFGAMLTNPIDASMLATIGPIVTLAIAYSTRAEQPNRLHIIGSIVAIAGSATMLIDRQATFDGSTNIYTGDIFVAISVVAAALHSTLARSQTQRYGALYVIALYFAMGTAMALPVLWDEFLEMLHRPLNSAIFCEIVYIALLGTALPLWLIYSATQRVAPTSAATYRYVQPLVAIVLAIVRGQTTPDDANILGMILIIFGVIMLGVATSKRVAIE